MASDNGCYADIPYVLWMILQKKSFGVIPISHTLVHGLTKIDPRRHVLWQRAKEFGLAGKCVQVSEVVSDIFAHISGKRLPINVDGVIGAIIADMDVDIDLAKIVFIFGRVAGLSAHYFEEISTQRPMRRINFSEAVYEGMADRDYPK